MRGRWVVRDGSLYLDFPREEWEAEVRRAVEWQVNFDRKIARYRIRYNALPRWRQFIFRWLNIGPGLEVTGFMKRKILGGEG